MHKFFRNGRGKVGSFAVVLALMAGCEWGSDGGFNTSRGAGAQINFSGVYQGYNGPLVAGRPVSRLTLAQVGNTVEVQDNNGSVYTGRVGSPGVVGTPDLNGNYGSGATLLQAQISFSGVNAATGTEARFTGMLRVVSVSEVRGVSSETEQSNLDEETVTVDSSTSQPHQGGTIDTNRQVTEEKSKSSSSGTTYAYTVTESNAHYILEGSWNEGGIAAVSGFARAASGIFSVVTTAGTGTGN